jgi:Xaa-Pro aminopeptidase
MTLGTENLTRKAALIPEITMERLPTRIDRLVQWMAQSSLDATVGFGSINSAHLAGYHRYYGGPSAVVVGRDGSVTLAVMFDEVPVARELGTADEVLPYGERGFGLNLNPLPLLAEVVAGTGPVRSARRIGFCDELGGMAPLIRSQSDAEQVDAAGALHDIRMLKDEDELAKVLFCYELCWMAQARVGELAQQAGITEIELFSAALSTAQNANGAPIEFLCDLLSGPLTSKVCCPIHVASPRVVQEGDAVVADVALGARGYFGDTAETHVVGENATAAEQRAQLLEILAQAGREMVPGTPASGIFANVDRRIKDAFPGGEFPHHGGHGISVSSFEDPHLIPTDHTPLQNWMLLACEPGVYFDGVSGARVENIFLVTPDGGVELRKAMGAL